MKNKDEKKINKAIIIAGIILVLILIAGLSFGNEIHPDLNSIEKSQTLRSNATYCIIAIFTIAAFLFGIYRIQKLISNENNAKEKKM